MTIEPISSARSFGGWHRQYRHRSRALQCAMRLPVYLPPLTLRLHPGYDHSYFFIATFIEEHLRFHAQRLA